MDVLWICNEHVGVDPSTLDGMLRACRASGMDTMVRMKPFNATHLLHALEAGAQGIMVPRISGSAEAARLVDEMKFPPLGHRGVDGVNADSGYGRVPFLEYLRRANEETFLVVQIEDADVLPELDAIAALPGVDVLFVGPADLSVALGVPGEFEHPRVLEICALVVEACRKHGKTAAIPVASEEAMRRRIEMGFRFLVGGSDFRFLKTGLQGARDVFARNGFGLR